MNTKTFAMIAVRVLAIWLIIGGLTMLFQVSGTVVDLLIRGSFDAIYGHGLTVILMAGGRLVIGIVLWLVAGVVASLMTTGQNAEEQIDHDVVYRNAETLGVLVFVGVGLIAIVFGLPLLLGTLFSELNTLDEYTYNHSFRVFPSMMMNLLYALVQPALGAALIYYARPLAKRFADQVSEGDQSVP